MNFCRSPPARYSSTRKIFAGRFRSSTKPTRCGWLKSRRIAISLSKFSWSFFVSRDRSMALTATTVLWAVSDAVVRASHTVA